jgi:AcrR family transcriptional regulator
MPGAPTTRRSTRERGEATVRRLLDAAGRLFAEQGYAATSLDAIVTSCGLTKGALYHHFAGKREVFEAVFDREQRRLCAAFDAAVERERDPLDGLHAGLRAFLAELLEPGTLRIALVDAPSALGWDPVRQLEAGYGIARVAGAIRAAVDAGRIPRRDVETLAHLLYGALSEGALFAGRSGDTAAAGRKVERELRGLLDGLTA